MLKNQLNADTDTCAQIFNGIMHMHVHLDIKLKKRGICVYLIENNQYVTL